MKTHTPLVLIVSLLLFGHVIPGMGQSQVQVDPAQGWAGYMNVFNLPADGSAYQFGNTWGAVDLRAGFSGALLTLRPCTNVSNPTDAYWVKPDGSGNKLMEANFYVDTATLVRSNVIFSGSVATFSLPGTHTLRAFIKVFPADYSSVLQSVYASITTNGAFSLNLNATDPLAAHVQYGFVMFGPNGSWTNAADATSYVTVRTTLFPLTLSAPAKPSNGKFGFALNGLALGRTNVIQVSSNLVSATNWTSLQIVPSPATGTTNVLDNNATNAIRFYRVLQLP